MGYIIAFTISVILAIYIMCDSLFQRKKKQIPTIIVEKKTNDQVVDRPREDVELNDFIRNHLYKNALFNFRHLKDSKNGYYYESGNFSVTIFEYSTYRTAQFFQVKPYKQLAVMRYNKQSLQELEVTFTKVPIELKGSVRKLFEKINIINFKNLHNMRADEEILDISEKIYTLINKLEQESDSLSSDMKYAVRRIKTIDLVEVMDRYESLEGFELEAGKIKVKESLIQIESQLTVQWQILIQKKRLEIERLEKVMGET